MSGTQTFPTIPDIFEWLLPLYTGPPTHSGVGKWKLLLTLLPSQQNPVTVSKISNNIHIITHEVLSSLGFVKQR